MDLVYGMGLRDPLRGVKRVRDGAIPSRPSTHSSLHALTTFLVVSYRVSYIFSSEIPVLHTLAPCNQRCNEFKLGMANYRQSPSTWLHLTADSSGA